MMPKCRIQKYLIAMVVCVSALGSTAAFANIYVGGQLVLRLTEGYPIDSVNARFGTSVAHRLPQLDIYLLNSGEPNLDSLAAEIETVPEVVFCHPNFLVDPLQSVQGSIPFGDLVGGEAYSNQQAASDLSLSKAQTISRGAGVTVAVIDGGVNYLHPELAGIVETGWDYVDDDGDPFDEPGGDNSGHGTFVAGVVHLAAPDAVIRAYRVTDLAGESDGYVVAEAILEAVEEECEIINLSMVMIRRHEAIRYAVQYAKDRDVLVMAAAGNGQGSEPRYPASDTNVIGVAAVDSMHQLASFSSFGEHVSLCAPGVDIYAPFTDSSYAYWGGTSFATPFVSAQAALLLSLDPTLSWYEIKDAILATADNIDDINPDFAGLLGEGMIDLIGATHFVVGDGVCGNADGSPDGAVTVGDMQALTEYLFADGAACDPLWIGNTDGRSGITNNDLQGLIDYIFRSQLPLCCAPLSPDPYPLSEDRLEIRETTVPPGQSNWMVELWVEAVDEFYGLAFPFAYGSDPPIVTLDSITLVAGGALDYGLIDALSGTGLVVINATSQAFPPGERLIASLHFSLEPQQDAQPILFSLAPYPPAHTVVLSRHSVTDAVQPIIVGLSSPLDADGDGIADETDNCPSRYNPRQLDGDADGVGDQCDNCAALANADQSDFDGDGYGDGCDQCPYDSLNDYDGDGYCAEADNCPSTFNPDQTDSDGDGDGDPCDVCPDDALNDADGDGFCADSDNCPDVANADQWDSDEDGVGDACDNCPDAFNPDQADVNDDGIGDACDTSFFSCGNANGDSLGALNITDLTYLLTYLYEDGPPPYPLWVADVDGLADITNNDAHALIDYIFVAQSEVSCDCVPDSAFPVSDDRLQVRGVIVPPGENSWTVQLWLDVIDDFHGLAFPFSFSCPTSGLSLTDIELHTCGEIDYSLIDNLASSGIISINKLEQDFPSGQHRVASLTFELTPSTQPQHIEVEPGFYPPSHTTVLSRLDGKGGVVPQVFSIPGDGECCLGRRGNVDGDSMEQVNIVDLTHLVHYLFAGGVEPPCWKEGNVDGDPDDVIRITDLTYLVCFLFDNGAQPPDCP